jgi:hypothetical protein
MIQVIYGFVILNQHLDTADTKSLPRKSDAETNNFYKSSNTLLRFLPKHTQPKTTANRHVTSY